MTGTATSRLSLLRVHSARAWEAGELLVAVAIVSRFLSQAVALCLSLITTGVRRWCGGRSSGRREMLPEGIPAQHHPFMQKKLDLQSTWKLVDAKSRARVGWTNGRLATAAATNRESCPFNRSAVPHPCKPHPLPCESTKDGTSCRETEGAPLHLSATAQRSPSILGGVAVGAHIRAGSFEWAARSEPISTKLGRRPV